MPHSWFGPMPQLPAAELLDHLEAKDGWQVQTIVPVPLWGPPDEAGQRALAGQGWMVLMRREARRVVLAGAFPRDARD